VRRFGPGSVRAAAPSPGEWTRCTLRRRRWLVQAGDGSESTVEGPGVVGLFPVVTRGNPDGVFQYASCTTTRAMRGASMGGQFYFRQGVGEGGADDVASLMAVDVPRWSMDLGEVLP
jgi:uncharacterized protein affecting Mg2+/Co2+ transport